MRMLIIDNGTTLLHKLEKLVGSHEITKKWNDISIADATSYDLIILSGSSQYSVVEDHSLFKKEVELIRSTRVPVIGICFGCELIAYAFGGGLGQLMTKHQGMRVIRFLGKEILSREKVKVYENHRAVITTMPDNFFVIASSDEGPEMIRHESLPIFGLQFHPENCVDETEGDEIFYKVLKLISPNLA